ncbi:MAG: MOSC domain-containing protein [Xanthomonadaceae bacterium]|nr:MOSC domain-containing protein [Xanthomonadaceae bacterium]
MATIQALNIYPVKSCRGIAVDTATVTPMGFHRDREWLIVDTNYRFITQREEPRLALIVPSLTREALELAAPGRGPLRVGLDEEGESVEVVIWKDRCAAFDLGTAASAWLSEHLGKPVRLVRFDRRRKRVSSREWTGDIEALTRFADAFPWLVISQASLDDLNARLPEALPMNRFRPNIVLGDVSPYAEDRAHELQAGNVVLRIVKPCTRCAIPTTDQETAERKSDQPLRALKAYRFDRKLKGVLFGQNAILIAGSGETLQVGQKMQVSWKS